MSIESPPQGDQAGAGGAHDEEQEPGGAPAAAEETRGRVEVKRTRLTNNSCGKFSVSIIAKSAMTSKLLLIETLHVPYKYLIFISSHNRNTSQS